MKARYLISVLIVTLGVSTHVQADESVLGASTTEAISATASPTPTTLPELKPFDYEHLKGSNAFGIGYGNLGTALSFRHWVSDDTALGLLVSGSYGENEQIDFSDKYVFLPNYSLNLGLEMKNNLARAQNNIYLQWVTIFSVAYSHSDSSTYQQSELYETLGFNLFTGPGFEAFLPFWKNLSIEGNVGLALSATGTYTQLASNPSYYGIGSTSSNTEWNFSLGTRNNAFSILNAYVHYYFE